jgi:RHS repeat-associated protein
VTHDAEGNIVEMADRFKRLTYDGNNRLSRIEFYPNESGEIRVDRYRYDPSGLRIKKEEYTGLSGETQKAVYYLYDGDQVLASETYEGSSIKETVVNVINGSDILASYTKVYSPSSEVLKYYYVDNLGSRTTITNAAGTTVEAAFAYDNWGNLLSGDHSKARFTNKELDASGLIYFNARYYNPTIGRFITEDPSKKGTGWYTYCSNNPINRTDPTGRMSDYALAQQENKQYLYNADRTEEDRQTARDNWELETAQDKIEHPERYERPTSPLPQQFLPNGDEACNVRAVMNQAEIASGKNFTAGELICMWYELEASGAIGSDNWVTDPNAILQRAFKEMRLPSVPYITSDPLDARGSVLRLERQVPLSRNWAMVEHNEYRIKIETHFQSGTGAGDLHWDPWGHDLSPNYSRTEVRYFVHY